MKTPDGHGKIKTDESLRETVQHGKEEYPLQYYLEDIFLFDFHCIDWHWHPEVELVLVREGTAEVSIGSERLVLDAGTGIFINAQAIHRFESKESAIIPNIVFSPFLLAQEESLLYRKYIRPVLHSSVNYRLFHPDDPDRREMLHTLKDVLAVQEQECVNEMKTVELLLRLWGMIYEDMDNTEPVRESQSCVCAQARLQIMMQYIHDHYREPITLDDIARTAMLGKSSVLKLFQKNIQTSPVSYLVGYRLKRAARLLATTENSVLSIAGDTGFENVGYFCRKFKEQFGLTPGEYRKSAKR